jgi:hypothetical protein
MPDSERAKQRLGKILDEVVPYPTMAGSYNSFPPLPLHAPKLTGADNAHITGSKLEMQLGALYVIERAENDLNFPLISFP